MLSIVNITFFIYSIYITSTMSYTLLTSMMKDITNRERISNQILYFVVYYIYGITVVWILVGAMRGILSDTSNPSHRMTTIVWSIPVYLYRVFPKPTEL
jgi:hypothetical protein